MKCCICGKEFHGWGNNPHGILNDDLSIREFTAKDYCCDECNVREVLPGRMLIKKAADIVKGLRNRLERKVEISDIQNLIDTETIKPSIGIFIITNLDRLNY